MVTLLRDQTAVTGQTPFEALAAASHPPPTDAVISHRGFCLAAPRGPRMI
jgi:hypothetical protein